MNATSKYVLLFLATTAIFVACKSSTPDPISVVNDTPYTPPANMITVMPASTQRSGDANKGYDYLINGNYVSSGFPLSIFASTGISLGSNELNRTGAAANIPYNFNLSTYPNGTQVISPNCLQCHAQYINNQLVIGLGSTTYDFTKGQTYGASTVGLDQNSFDALAGIIQKRSQTEWEAFQPIYRGVTATRSYLVTDVVGANAAIKLAAVLGIYRDNKSLAWLDAPTAKITDEIYPSDVPPFWNLKKKNALFYAGWGRGDLSRMMATTGMLTMKDSSEARQIDNHFNDVFAYLKSITPPKYTQTIDQSLVPTGQKIFTIKCAGCHGTYETGNVTYPNYIVSTDLVGTDANLIKDSFHKDLYINWYNSSWYATTKPTAHIENSNGYVAPPLDGIWASAPYLHNGSVPTLDDLLYSSQRPKYWRKIILADGKTIKLDAYDFTKVGWQYTSETGKTDKFTYDTTKPGYGNQGHTFGDGLSGSDRKALIEYLKTL